MDLKLCMCSGFWVLGLDWEWMGGMGYGVWGVDGTVGISEKIPRKFSEDS